MIQESIKKVLKRSSLGNTILTFLGGIRHRFGPSQGTPVFPNSDYGVYSSNGCVYLAGFSDPEFLALHQKYPDHYPPTASMNRYLQYALARTVLSINGGNFIECGVLTGKSCDVFANVIDNWDTQCRKIYGFDSFEGFAAPEERDLDVRVGRQSFKKGSCRGWGRQKIMDALSYHKCKIELVQGWIPSCFQGYENMNFCFAHLDVDLYRSTFDAISYVYPRMLKEGIILIDDYGFPMTPGARKAVDDYLKDKPELVISLPTGQAFLIKQ